MIYIYLKKAVIDSVTDTPHVCWTAQPELPLRHHPTNTRVPARSCRSCRLPTEAGLIPEICCAAAATVRIQTCSLLRGLWRRSNTTLHFNNRRGSSQQPHTNTGVGVFVKRTAELCRSFPTLATGAIYSGINANLATETFPAVTMQILKTQAVERHVTPPAPSFPWRLWDSWKLILQIPGCHCASRITFLEISHAFLHHVWGGGDAHCEFCGRESFWGSFTLALSMPQRTGSVNISQSRKNKLSSSCVTKYKACSITWPNIYFQSLRI